MYKLCISEWGAFDVNFNRDNGSTSYEAQMSALPFALSTDLRQSWESNDNNNDKLNINKTH